MLLTHTLLIRKILFGFFPKKFQVEVLNTTCLRPYSIVNRQVIQPFYLFFYLFPHLLLLYPSPFNTTRVFETIKVDFFLQGVLNSFQILFLVFWPDYGSLVCQLFFYQSLSLFSSSFYNIFI